MNTDLNTKLIEKVKELYSVLSDKYGTRFSDGSNLSYQTTLRDWIFSIKDLKICLEDKVNYIDEIIIDARDNYWNLPLDKDFIKNKILLKSSDKNISIESNTNNSDLNNSVLSVIKMSIYDYGSALTRFDDIEIISKTKYWKEYLEKHNIHNGEYVIKAYNNLSSKNTNFAPKLIDIKDECLNLMQIENEFDSKLYELYSKLKSISKFNYEFKDFKLEISKVSKEFDIDYFFTNLKSLELYIKEFDINNLIIKDIICFFVAKRKNLITPYHALQLSYSGVLDDVLVKNVFLSVSSRFNFNDLHNKELFIRNYNQEVLKYIKPCQVKEEGLDEYDPKYIVQVVENLLKKVSKKNI